MKMCVSYTSTAGSGQLEPPTSSKSLGVRNSEVNMEARRDCREDSGVASKLEDDYSCCWHLEVEKPEQHELVLQRGVEAPAALLARHLRAEADRQLLQQHRRHGRRADAIRRRSK